MSDDLVERARVGAEKVYGTQFFNVEIEAAIAVVLEEAAKVCDEYSASEMKFFNEEGGLAALGRANAAEDLAAAIRAMIPSGNNP